MTVDGIATNESFGFSVDGVGDVNGDGRGDFVVGVVDAVTNNSLTGAARVFSGSDGSLLYNFAGDANFDQFGISVAGVGDLNGDGRGDLAVGASDAIGFGKVRVISGATGGTLFDVPGLAVNGGFGTSVAPAGDVNDDGTPDLIIGSPYGNEDTGQARIVSGVDGSEIRTLFGSAPGGLFGFSVSGAGDYDNDGHADVLIGSPRTQENGPDTGSARVYSGKTGSLLDTFVGPTSDDQFGFSVDAAGDLDNDGQIDLLIGANVTDPNGRDVGSVFAYSGATGNQLLRNDGDSIDGFLGQDVAGIGDVNSDGFDDILAGTPGDDANGDFSGSVQVFSGIDGSVIYDFKGDNAFDQFGRSVGAAGDVNNDGVPDFLVGADRGGPQSAGYARLFLSSLIGDANGDGRVNLADFGILRANFGGQGSFVQGDFNQDGTINLADFGLLRANFGSVVSATDLVMVDAWAASVPEPAVALLAMPAGLLLRRRRAARR